MGNKDQKNKETKNKKKQQQNVLRVTRQRITETYVKF